MGDWWPMLTQGIIGMLTAFKPFEPPEGLEFRPRNDLFRQSHTLPSTWDRERDFSTEFPLTRAASSKHRYRELLPEDCAAIRPCLATSTNCTGDGIFDIDLTRHCSNAEGNTVFMTLLEVGSDRPIQLQIYDKTTGAKDVALVRKLVVALKIWGSMDEYITARLPALNLPNLVRLEIIIGHMLEVEKADFRNNLKLRYISFFGASFASIGVDTFTNLPDLQHLSVERFFLSLLQDPEYETSTTQLHCGCQNQWFRAWLERNPTIIAPKSVEELRKMGVFRAEAVQRKDIYLPVDCKKHNVTEFWNDDQPRRFTLNDPCA